jgi:predicted tellurium resistance membrane protein TerC
MALSVDPTDPIIIACALMAGTTIVRHIAKPAKKATASDQYIKPILYGFFLAIGLLLLAIPFPTFAKYLAYLGIVGAFAVNGPTIYGLVK